MSYAEFLERKAQHRGNEGFDPEWIPEFLFDFQQALTEWSLRRGKAAIFADCGLGKSPMELVWAQNIYKHTGKPVLIICPLAVSFQMQTEAEKFGIEAQVSRDGSVPSSITITNYERLHLFNRDDFAGAVCDESSAIKNFDGVRRALVTNFLRKMPYRLLGTATAAPNDYIELGTSSEALGELGHMDMLGRFFTNNNHNAIAGMRYRWSKQGSFAGLQWRFKGHAEEPFWRWVASWARALRRPSDLGFADERFILPELEYRQTIVQARTPNPDALFELPAVGLQEERAESRRTITERCEAAANLLEDVETAVAWCQLNAEGDLLTKLIPGAVQVKGGDDPDAKEEALLAFSRGDIRVLVSKPSITAWGLNWQHCNHMTFFPSHSFEQMYQAVRRCWRFGQTQPVTVDVITTEGGRNALENLQRKADAADRMFDGLIAHMNDAMKLGSNEGFAQPVEVPPWLSPTK